MNTNGFADLRLTVRQGEVLAFIVSYLRKHGYPPSHREIGAQLNISSPNGVRGHIKALIAKGLITFEEKHARAICITRVGKQWLAMGK